MPGGMWLILLGGFIALLINLPFIDILVLLVTLGLAQLLPALLFNVGFLVLLVSGLRGKIDSGWLVLPLCWFGVGLLVSVYSRYEIGALHRNMAKTNAAVQRPSPEHLEGVSVENEPSFGGNYRLGGLLENYPVGKLRTGNNLSFLAAAEYCGNNFYGSGLARREIDHRSVTLPETPGGGVQLVKGVCRLSMAAVAGIWPNRETEIQAKVLPHTSVSIPRLKVMRLDVRTPDGAHYAVVVGEATPYPPIPIPIFASVGCSGRDRLADRKPKAECSIFQPSNLERHLLGVEGGAGDNRARAMAFALGLKPVFADQRIEAIERASPKLDELKRLLPQKY